MIYVDAIAHQSLFASWQPKMRITITLILLVVSVMMDNQMLYAAILAGSLVGIIVLTRQNIVVLVKILSIPMFFIGVASCLIMFSFVRDVPEEYLIKITDHILITQSGLQLAHEVLLRSVATVCLVFSMTLTIPMAHLIDWMVWLKVPPTFIQLFMLSYRMIFVVFEEALELILSQQLRFGFIYPRTTFNSVRQMASMLFMRVIWRMSDMDQAMQIRFYYEK